MVTFEIRDDENFDTAMERYRKELADAGFGYEDTTLTDAELEAFAATSDDNRKMVKNYERGILTGGEFDMRRLAK